MTKWLRLIRRTTQLEQQAAGFQVDGSTQECRLGDPSIWFKVIVRNVGHRGAYLNTCDIRALDHAGRATLTATVRTGWLNFPAGPYLAAGEQVFFVSPLIDTGGDSVLAAPAGTIAYEVSCPPTSRPHSTGALPFPSAPWRRRPTPGSPGQ